MAGGTDQSVNLSGMLNSIAQTIGSGYTIAGKSAGEAMGDQIANAFRPKVDPNDPDSMLKYAEWAKRNGKPEEARMYEDKAAMLKKEMGEANAIAAAASYGEKGMGMVGNGDVEGFSGMLSSMNKDIQAAAQRGDLATARALQGQSQSLQAQRPALIENSVNNRANQVLKLEQTLADGYVQDREGNKRELTDQQREAMQMANNRLQEDHKVVARTNQMALQQHQVNVAQKAQERDAAVAQVTPAVMAAGSQEELEDAIAKVPPEVYADMLPILNAKEAQLVRREEREQKAIDKQTSVFVEEDIEALRGRIAELPEAQQEVWNREVEKLEDLNEKAMPGGNYATLESRSAMKQRFNQLDNMIMNAWAQDTADRTRRERNEKDMRKTELLKAELDLVSPLNPDEVRRWAEANDITPAEAETQLRSAQQKAFRELMAIADPDRAAAEQSEIDARVNEDLPEAVKNDAQADILRKVRGKSSAAGMSDDEIIQFLKDEKMWPADGDPKNWSTRLVEGVTGAVSGVVEGAGESARNYWEVYTRPYSEILRSIRNGED